jgi:oligoribonuclease (3'-5' exoribonuclease)
MNTKVIWIDTETTSLDPKVASIRELAYVAEIDGHQIGEIQALIIKNFIKKISINLQFIV